MSKGSNRRPSDVDGETFAQRWERTFSNGRADVPEMRRLLREEARAGALTWSTLASGEGTQVLLVADAQEKP